MMESEEGALLKEAGDGDSEAFERLISSACVWALGKVLAVG